MKLTFGDIKTLFPDHTLTVPDRETVTGISHDSRTIKPGEIYVALKGRRFDGHRFVAEALSRGARAAIVEKGCQAVGPLIRVDDSLAALGRLAASYRDRFKQPVVAITGSNGKTTTKEWLAHTLRLKGTVVATDGNLNNHIGVPLTIFKFSDDADFFVVEMGMSHPGEIRTLAKITRPDMALITSIGLSHLEGVGETLADVARAKGELFEELPNTATAFVFGDDPFIKKMPTRARRVTYGFSDGNDVRASRIVVGGHKTDFEIRDGNTALAVTIPLVGRHHVQNALAVYAIASRLGVSAACVARGLASFQIRINRGRRIDCGDLIIIDDSYNANPSSMQAMLESFRDEYPDVPRLAALGEMLELGQAAAQWHRDVGAACRRLGIRGLFVYGKLAEHYLRGFGYGPSEVPGHIFSDHASLAGALKKWVGQHRRVGSPRVAVLLKGSRGAKMERVLEYL